MQSHGGFGEEKIEGAIEKPNASINQRLGPLLPCLPHSGCASRELNQPTLCASLNWANGTGKKPPA
jgi:hypothetical protein